MRKLYELSSCVQFQHPCRDRSVKTRASIVKDSSATAQDLLGVTFIDDMARKKTSSKICECSTSGHHMHPCADVQIGFLYPLVDELLSSANRCVSVPPETIRSLFFRRSRICEQARPLKPRFFFPRTVEPRHKTPPLAPGNSCDSLAPSKSSSVDVGLPHTLVKKSARLFRAPRWRA